MEIDLLILLVLIAAGAMAGFVDAIAGGGGLITVPVMLALGFPPVAAFATNKVQSAVGTTIAALTYWRRGFVRVEELLPALVVTFVGAFLGALAVRSLDTSLLAYAVPLALILVAVYFSLAPRLTDADRKARLRFGCWVPVMGFCVGFYDGIFGPGAGSFFTMGFIALFGLGVTRAAASTKLVNLASNFGALALFVPAGDVLWPAAFAMAGGQLAGGYIGARTGIRFGARLIRPLVVIVSITLALRLLLFP